MSADRPAVSLVVNADDFGLRPSIDRGILRAHREGIVTSTSVLGTCADPVEVRRQLAEAPGLGVGAHLTLLGGRPVSTAPLTGVLGPDGAFPLQARVLFLAWSRGLLVQAELEREFDAQVARLRDAGLTLDHVDTHQHVGFLPPVGKAIEAVARRHGIPGLRSVVEPPSLAWVTEPGRGVRAALLGGLSWLTRRELGALRHGPTTWGYVESGQLDEVRILEILGRLGPGAHELICHPGEDPAPDEPGGTASSAHRRVQELRALTSPLVREALTRRGIALCRWRDLF